MGKLTFRYATYYIYSKPCFFIYDDKASNGRIDKNSQTKLGNLLGCALSVFLERELISKIKLSTEFTETIIYNYENILNYAQVLTPCVGGDLRMVVERLLPTKLLFMIKLANLWL